MSAPGVAETLLLAIVERGPALSVQQVQGNACVWCPAVLLPGDGVDIRGGRTAERDWWPHACKACYANNLRSVATALDWNDHLLGCAACCQHAPCSTVGTLRAAHIEARRRIGRPAVWCRECLRVMRSDELWQPHLWQSRRGTELSYRHAGTCPQP
ncbi:hypothetical protein C9F11_37210 [Streptomyces sp. YIM 121038]|uniref:hypothetical protein n=1 Tax=Streptomyces sp. YIM 121038 TaxID=2136401 RepID=UPI0011106DDF|nr:hypothetical protein [Streptomyces sp. YIM 121038]QCX81025.1 hypothetical protein C9F11_37210 [Streptomyces sp. YIM 121038]